MKKVLKIKQATAKGYVEVEEYGCFNAAYPSSETRRGRVIEGGGNCSNHYGILGRFDNPLFGIWKQKRYA